MSTQERDEILAALHKFVRQRPGFDFANYGNASAYRADVRVATRQLHDAEAMLSAISWRGSIDAEDIRSALRRGFAGRLVWNGKALSYTAGQYYPLEFRASVCAALACALWDYWRRNDDKSTGDTVRKTARRELGVAIGRRWFS